MSKLDPGDDYAGSGLIPMLTGQSAADAANRGAEAQTKFSQQAMELLRANLSPYRQAGIPAAGEALRLTDPMQQVAFLAQSPVFGSMSDRLVQNTLASAAARGKAGAGGTQEDIQTSLIQLGNTLIDNQINRQLPLISMGQRAAVGQGAGSVDLLQGIGNAQAAGGIGAANAQAQGSQNVMSLLSTLGSAFGGGSNQTNANNGYTGYNNSTTINTGSNYEGMV